MCEWEIPVEQSETIKTCGECGADLSRWTSRKIKPPPIPVQVESESTGGESFARHASTFSVVAPIFAIAILIAGPVIGAASNWFGSGIRVGMTIINGTVLLLIFSGFVLGIVALVLPKKGKGGAIIGKSIVGVCLNGLLIATLLIAIPVFIKVAVRAREMERQRQEERQR
jgi:hypothetical protein